MKLDFSEVLGQDPPGGATVDNSAKLETYPKIRKQYEPPVKSADPFDLDRAKKNLSVYEDKIRQMNLEINKLEVKTDASAAIITEMISQSAGLIKMLEKKRKDTIYDCDQFVRAVNRFVKIYRDQVDAIVRVGKKKLGAYQYQKELKRREAEKKAQDEVDRIQKEMDAKAEKGGFEPVKMPTIVAPRKADPVRTESGSASTRMVWKWKVSNDNAIPRDYLMVDGKAIDAAIKAGLREIPGISIFEEADVRIRTA
jgi:hypothetical protein